MLKYFTTLLAGIIIPVFVFAADYTASSIDKGLLTHADAVVREYNLEVDIESANRVYMTEHKVITVLNEKGNDFANQQAFYSSLVDLQSVEGRIYDKEGDLVKKIRMQDFGTRNVSANTRAYTDAMERYYFVDYRIYPYTVEYTIKTRQNYTFYLPEWEPQPSANCAVEHASLTLISPDDFRLRFRENLVPEASANKANGITTRQWEVKQVNAYVREPLSYSTESLKPLITIAPVQFSCEGYDGTMDTWKAMGDFIFSLNKDREQLPDETRDKVKQLISNITDPIQKIKVLYAYLQQSTRYVSVQYGIGGWQTIDAATVDKNKYGDCKALSNYMMALLAVAGIQSYPVVIFGEEDEKRSFSKQFPHCQGNHEILCVPMAKDTIWLECTSPFNTANYLGDFTDDRTALMITPAGGVLVHTPVYDTDVNFKTGKAIIVCGGEGVLKVEMNNHYSGYMASDVNGRIKYSQPHEMQEYENSKFGMASYTADRYNFKPVADDPYMAVDEHVEITANSMYNKRGNRYFINMNVAPLKKKYTTMSTERKTSFYLNNSVTVKDTIVLNLPANTTVEYKPDAVTATYPFGHYSCVVTEAGTQLLLTREFMQHGGVYAKELYHDYEKFCTLINNGNPTNVVLVHN